MPKGIKGFQKGHNNFLIPRTHHWKIKDTSRMKGHHPKTEFKKGKIPWNKNKSWSQKVKEKMSKTQRGMKKPWMIEIMKKRIGDKNNNWIDGRSKNKKYKNWLKNKRNRLKRLLNKDGSSHTFGEWELLKKQYDYRCPSCGKLEPEIRLTEDHIIPLSKGGSDNIENIQPLCQGCNSRKQTKIIKFNK